MNNFIKQTTNLNNNDRKITKRLPNSFTDDSDEITLRRAFLYSVMAHPLAILIAWILFAGLTFLGLVPNEFNKPSLKVQDIEFILVNKEGEPIDKNTKFRSDRNSQAGGIHDPKRKIAEPSPAGPKTKKPTPSKSGGGQSKTPPKAAQPKQANAPVQQASPAQSKTISKPKQAYAPKPTVNPNLPSGALTRPQMPKVVQTPKSPFTVGVPNTNLPKGPVPSTSKGTAKYGGQGGGTPSGSGNRMASMPAPQFSKGQGTGTGVGNGKGSGYGTGKGTGTGGGGGQGGYGTNGWGNPGPGNPNGTPGVDAIKQADWGPYMRELERRIKRNWNPPKGDTSKRVVMLFTIGRDGRLVSIKTLKSSGSPENDRAAKAAIELTAPFKSLPPEYKGNNVDIEFTFDYNVLGARSYR